MDIKKRKTIAGISFILPYVFGMIPFFVFPLIYSLWLSLHSWNGFTGMNWIGLSNYTQIFSDSSFWLAIQNTVYMWLVHVIPMLVLALFFAIILNSTKMRGKSFFRTALFLPNITAIVAVALVFKFMMSTDYGIINSLLNIFSIGPIKWLTSASWSKISVVIIVIWRSLGWFMLVFLAGLQGIEKQFYEAAKIDGANRWQTFRYITVPQLMHIIKFAIIIDTIGSFRLLVEPLLLWGQGVSINLIGPFDSASTIMTLLYRSAFVNSQFGYASAIAWVAMSIIVAISLIQFKIIDRE